MASVLKEANLLFDGDKREEAYGYLARVISEESPSVIGDEQTPISDVDFNRFVNHCSLDLSDWQPNYQMKRCALEVLSWVFCRDFLACDNSLLDRIASLQAVKSVVERICKILESSDEDMICFALFFVSEQCIPVLFEPVAENLCSVLLNCLAQSSPRNVRLYAYRAMTNLLPSLHTWIIQSNISAAALAMDLVRDWKGEDRKVREASLKFSEACSSRACLPLLIPRAAQETKHLMLHLCSSLRSAASDEQQEVAMEVSSIWRMWICGTPVKSLVPLLREGSTSITTTGYVLQPFELLYRQSVAEGVKCWQVLTSCLCKQQNWMDMHPKVLKLVLRFLSTALREQGVFDAVRSTGVDSWADSYGNIAVLEALIDLLGGLAQHAWPRPQSLIDFVFSANGTAASSVGFTPGTVAHIITALSSRFMWCFEQSSARTLCQTRDMHALVRHLDVCIVMVCGAARVCETVLGRVSSHRKAGRCTTNCDSESGKLPCSLFEEKPLCPAMEDLPDVSGVDVTRSTTSLIMAQMEALGGVHRRLHMWRVDLASFLAADPLPSTAAGELMEVLGTCICRVEASMRGLVECTRNLVIATGYSLVTECANHSESEEGAHVILTLDSDGANHMVLTSATQVTADIVQEILLGIVQTWRSVWCAPLGCRLTLHREMLLESVMWLLHRTSSFDCVVSRRDMERVCEAVCGMFGSRHHAPLVTVSVLLLLCLSHAELLDDAEAHTAAADVESMVSMYLQSTDNRDTGNCAVLRRGIVRCMHGITESISLPGLLKWLPFMIVFSCTSDDESHRQSHSVGVSPIKLSALQVQESEHQRTVPYDFHYLSVHGGVNSIGSNWCSLLSAMMGAALVELSALSPGLTDDSGEEVSDDIRRNMTLCIRNLLFAPFSLMRKSCQGLRYLLDGAAIKSEAATAVRCGSASSSNGVLVWKHMFGVWLHLEERNTQKVAYWFSQFSDACNGECGAIARPLPADALARDQDVMGSLLLAAVDCLRTELQGGGVEPAGRSSASARELRLCQEAIGVTLTNAVLSWWARIDGMCLQLSHIMASYAGDRQRDINSICDALSVLMSNKVLGVLLESITRAKMILLLPYVQVNRVLSSVSSSAASISASAPTPNSSSAALDTLITGSAMSVCHSMVFDVCLKLIVLARSCSSLAIDAIPLEYPVFVCDVIIHLTAFKGIKVDGCSPKGYIASVKSFVERCFLLIPEDHSLHLLLKRFWAEWFSEDVCVGTEVLVDYESMYLGPEKHPFMALERGLVQHRSSQATSQMDSGVGPDRLAPAAAVKTNRVKVTTPSGIVKRSFAAPALTIAATPSSTSMAAVSPYSPIINIHVGKPNETSAEISSVLGKRREQELARHERVNLAPGTGGTSTGPERIVKARQWDVVPTYSTSDRAVLTARSQQQCSDSYQESCMESVQERGFDGVETCDIASDDRNCQEQTREGEEGAVDCTEVDNDNEGDKDTAVDGEATLLDIVVASDSAMKSGKGEETVPVTACAATSASATVDGCRGEVGGVVCVPLESDDTLTGVTLLSAAVNRTDHCNGGIIPAGNDSMIQEVDDSDHSDMASVMTYILHANGILGDLIQATSSELDEEVGVSVDDRLRQLDDAAVACNELMGHILRYRKMTRWKRRICLATE